MTKAKIPSKKAAPPRGASAHPSTKKGKAATPAPAVEVQDTPLSRIKANPSNPRVLRDEKFAKLKKSIQDFPDMLNYRALVCVTDTDGKLMVLGGNMRLRALQDLGIKSAPVMLADHWTEEQRRRFIIADNVGFGEWEWDSIEDEWNEALLEEWGMEDKRPSALKKTYDMLNGKFDGTKIEYPVTIILTPAEFREWKKMKKEIGSIEDNDAFWKITKGYIEELKKEAEK